MSLDAMKQALEALNMELPSGSYLEVKTALRAAIEQAEKQEPVAWREFDGEGGYDYRTYDDNENFRDEYIKRNGEKYAGWVEPLYTAPPPPQRQPLTEAERNHLWETLYDHGNGKYMGEQSRAQRERAFAILKKIGGEHD